MNRYALLKSTLVAAIAAVSGTAAHANEYVARFSGFEELGALNAETGAIYSPNGTGTLLLNLNRGAGTLAYTLTFSGLSAPVLQSHIHFGKEHVPGGVMVFLCTNLNNGPAGTPACPAGGGTVTGTITAADVVGPASQGVAAGNFDAVVAALVSNTAYGNIHTANFPAGEIRGQISPLESENEQ